MLKLICKDVNTVLLNKNMHLYVYKIQTALKLKPPSHNQRRNFVNWLLEHNASNIILSDESYFILDDL